jgi:hypothetical protein
LTVKTGDGDLGGFLRLRLGHLLPKHEKKEEGEDDGDDAEDEKEESPAVTEKEDELSSESRKV